jgi:sulfite exporter TauE/SafE
MIGTIGFLVQETSNRRRWLLATSLYTVACVTTAALLGTLLGAAGQLMRGLFGPPLALPGGLLVGTIAIAYAVSDVGLARLPRPTLKHAVPVSWWRKWKPYGAALAYGAALGIGVMTQMPFGAFYVLCAWCIVHGSPAYAALLLGTYGAARALVMFPASWGVYCHRAAITEWLTGPLFDQWRAQRIIAVALTIFGAQAIVTTIMVTLPVIAP